MVRRSDEAEREKAALADANKPKTLGKRRAFVPRTLHDNLVRVIPLGGVEEVGKNMTAVEYNDDIVIIDCGFQFPDESEAPGIDYIIPDISYLEKKKKKVKAILITHGHLDHIGGLPYIVSKIGNPTIYSRELTGAIILKRQMEFPHLPPLNIKVVEKNSVLEIGELKVKFFNVTHTIPDSMGISVVTPVGNIVFTGDFKIDHEKGVPAQHEVETYETIGRDNNLVLLADSTNAWKPGFSFSERDVHANIRKILEDQKGRLIIGTFSSLLERLIFIISCAEELGKKVAVEGRSMRDNLEIAKVLKMINAKKDTIIQAGELSNYPENRVIILATGAQGDEYAALMRMSRNEHPHIKLHRGDTIILSSSVVPGNEKAVQRLKDNLSRRGPKIISYLVLDVHASGHANREECKWIMQKIKPRFFIPIHGYHQFLQEHAEAAGEAGIPLPNIVIPDNGSVIEFPEAGTKIRVSKEKVSQGVVMVDGLGSGNVQEVVIRDRQQLAQDGMFVIISVVDSRTGKVKQSPDIISRGFVYLKESQDLLQGARYLIRKTIEDTVKDMRPINLDYVRNTIKEELGKFLFQKTAKRPIILPVILEV